MRRLLAKLVLLLALLCLLLRPSPAKADPDEGTCPIPQCYSMWSACIAYRGYWDDWWYTDSGALCGDVYEYYCWYPGSQMEAYGNCGDY